MRKFSGCLPCRSGPVYAFNAKNINERRAYNNEIARTILGDPQREAYGPTEIEKVDIYKTKRANGPIMIFIYGGSWQGGRSSQFTVYAEPFVQANRAPVAARQEPQLQAPEPAAKPRRKMNAAARKKISQAMKRRHAERKAAALKK